MVGASNFGLFSRSYNQTLCFNENYEKMLRIRDSHWFARNLSTAGIWSCMCETGNFVLVWLSFFFQQLLGECLGMQAWPVEHAGTCDWQGFVVMFFSEGIKPQVWGIYRVIDLAMPCRSAQQKVRRDRLVGEVVRRLHNKLKKPDQQKRIALTSRLLPLGSLRKRKVQKIVGGWPNEYHGRRCFTKVLVKDVNAILRSRYGLEPSDAEESRIKRLLQNVRKRKLGLAAMVVNPDELETLPMNLEERMFSNIDSARSF